MVEVDKTLELKLVSKERFKFSGNVISEFGKESISNPVIAVFELIKNSYDADAKKVSIRITNAHKKDAKIIISDNGTGMNLADISNKFMEIGKSYKKYSKKTSIYDRVYSGSKGIGRFAAQCLGQKMTIHTGKRGDEVNYSIEFDWNKFNDKNRATDVDIEIKQFPKVKENQGTKVIIEELNDDWNDNTLVKKFNDELGILLQPNNQPRKFKINNELAKTTQTDIPDKKFLENAVYKLKVKLEKSRSIIFEFYKAGKLIKKEKGHDLSEKLNCGDTSFELYFYHREPRSWKKRTDNDISEEEISKIRKVLDTYGGIKIYRDYFRVMPYGSRGADWINLDRLSRDNTMIPGNLQVFGLVQISSETNPKLTDTTSREGLMTTPEYYDLVRLVTTSISKLFVDLRSEVERDKIKARKPKKIAKKVKVVDPKDEGLSIKEESKFIDVKIDFPSNHYDKILSEIEGCVREKYVNAAFVLSRKVIENLVYDVLCKKYPSDPDIWYEKGKARARGFDTLISELYIRRKEFQPNITDKIEQFKADVGRLRRNANKTIHRDSFYLEELSDLESYKINKITQLLLEIYSGANN